MRAFGAILCVISSVSTKQGSGKNGEVDDPPRVEPATIEDLPALTELVMELFSRSGDFKPDRALQERGLDRKSVV